MNTVEFFNSFISKAVHKDKQTYDEYKNIDADYLVKATTLYFIYKRNVKDALSINDFYNIAGQYLYFDKYLCEHGTEYYYHVSFNKDNTRYKNVAPIIENNIKRNDPSTLVDLITVWEAVSK